MRWGIRHNFLEGRGRLAGSCGSSEYGSSNGESGIHFSSIREPQSRGLDNCFDMEGMGEGGVMKDTKISGQDPGGELEDREQAGLQGRGVANQYLHVCTS